MAIQFNSRAMTTGERVDHLRRLLKARCKMYHLAIGITQLYNGPIKFSINGAVRSTLGQNFTINQDGDDFADLLLNIIDSIESLDQSKVELDEN